jgi:hypothetical protein
VTAPGPQLSIALQERHQDLLRAETELYAAEQVARLPWRRAFGGVLPEGYDPGSIAAEALLQLFSRSQTQPSSPRFPQAEDSIPGVTWTLHKNPSSQAETSLPQLRQELRRLVRQQIDRLRHLKETSLLRNEPDLARLKTDDADWISPVDALPASSPNPLDILIQRETEAELDQLKSQFSAFLGRERGLKKLFHHLCAGERRPGTLARKLGVRIGTVKNLKKRLNRQLDAFRRHKLC